MKTTGAAGWRQPVAKRLIYEWENYVQIDAHKTIVLSDHSVYD